MKFYDPKWTEFAMSQDFGGSADDRLFAYLRGLGYTGAIDEMMYNYMGDLGYTGSLADRLKGVNPLTDLIQEPDAVFGDSLAVWLVTDDDVKRTITSGAFQAIIDQTSSSEISHGTAANRPVLDETGGPKGQSVALFTGSSVHHLIDQSGAYPALSQPFWSAGIVKASAASAGQRNHICYGITGNAALRVDDLGRLDVYAGGTSIVGDSIDDAAWHTFIAYYSGASSWLVVDGGTQIDGVDIGAGGLTQLTVGTGGGFGVADSLTGGILELIFGEGEPTVNQLSKLTSYLNSRMS